MITLYSTHCPRCEVLEKKLKTVGIDYQIETDINKMKEKGFTAAPMLEVDGRIMDFNKAVQWLRGGVYGN